MESSNEESFNEDSLVDLSENEAPNPAPIQAETMIPAQVQTNSNQIEVAIVIPEAVIYTETQMQTAITKATNNATYRGILGMLVIDVMVIFILMLIAAFTT